MSPRDRPFTSRGKERGNNQYRQLIVAMLGHIMRMTPCPPSRLSEKAQEEHKNKTRNKSQNNAIQVGPTPFYLHILFIFDLILPCVRWFHQVLSSHPSSSLGTLFGTGTSTQQPHQPQATERHRQRAPRVERWQVTLRLAATWRRPLRLPQRH